MALTYDKILIANDIRGKQGEAGFAPRINATTGTWERWDGTAWTDIGIKAQGDPADITGQSLYEYAVTNGFAGTYDDWLKEYLGRNTDLPWCLGYFQNRSLPANTYSTLSPIVTMGDASMVDESKILISESGLYEFFVGGGAGNTATTWFVTLTLNTTTNNTSGSSDIVGFGYWASMFIIPPFSTKVYLESGDFLVHQMSPAGAQSTINNYGKTHIFFARKVI